MDKLSEYAKDKRRKAFLGWYGGIILEREAAQPGSTVKINDDHALLERAFLAGWESSATLEEDARHRAAR